MTDIPGYEGLYAITEDGQVWSYRSNKFLSRQVDRDGYLRVHFRVNGKSSYPRIHRLLAETYIPNPDNKPTVDHINRDKMDNRICNLRWATMAE